MTGDRVRSGKIGTTQICVLGVSVVLKLYLNNYK